MSRISKSVNNNLNFRIGLNNNYYVYSKNKRKMIKICKQIQKSCNSIYYNTKHKSYVIRVKCKKHKNELLKIFKNRKENK
jgi:hypothetical protein